MLGYYVLGACHVVIFMFVRWYMKSEFITRGGEHTFGTLMILWVIVLPLMTLVTGLGIDMTGSYEASARFTAGGISVLMAMTWALPLIMLTTDVLSSRSVDRMMGLTREMVDEADLTKARDLLRKEDREGALIEIMQQRDSFPKAPSPRFMLAALAHDDRDYEKEAEYYREIMQECGHLEWAWQNAAQSLADLLRGELEDESAARYLDAEVARRNPDVQYKMSKTAKRKKAAQRYKRKRMGPSRPKRENRSSQAELVDLNHARRLALREDVAEAVALFHRYLADHPGEVKVHFELVTLYERNGRVDEATARLQKLIHEFGEDNDVWGNAMLRLATVRETHEGNRVAARKILEDVAARLKHANHGKEARQRIKDMNERESGGVPGGF